MISIKNVTKKYGKFVALDSVSLDLPDIGLVALTGENGCGKTTLLNIISTVDKPKEGSVTYNGTEYSSKSYRFLRKNIITYVQQDHFFVDYLNIRDNLTLSGASSEDVSDNLKKYGIPEKATAETVELSGGQKQKCSFIRGVVRNTPVLLVDEPTSSMDKESEKFTFEILHELSKDRLVILVSHNQTLIGDFSDLIIRMDKGKIADIYDNGNAARAYEKDGTVFVPDNEKYKLSRDLDLIFDKLSEKRSLKLELKAMDSQSGSFLNYTGTGKTVASNLHHSIKKPLKAALVSLGRQSVRIALIALFMSVLILISSLMLSLKEVNTSQLFYDLIKENGYDDILYNRNFNSYFSVDEELRMSYHDAFELAEKYNTRCMVYYINNYDGFIDPGFSSRLPFKYKKINNIILIDCSHPEYYELAAGKLPAGSEIMITDYLAEQYISNKMYADYDDILSKGIVLKNYNTKVSGILKTGYEKYSSLTSIFSETNKNDESHAEYLGSNYCSSIYMNYENYLAFKTDEIKLVYMGDGFFADICSVPVTEYSSGIYVNEVYSGLSSDAYFLSKYVFGEIEGVIEDSKENPTVYVTSDLYSEMSKNKDLESHFTLFSFNINSTELMEEIESYKGSYETPLKDIYYSAYDAIYTAQREVKYYIIFAAAVTALFGLWMWIEISKKQRYLGYALITNGFAPYHLTLFTAVRMAALCAADAILSTVLYYAASSIINKIISDMSGYKFVVMQGALQPHLEALAINLCAFCLISALFSVFYYVRRPINIYLSMSKA